jgi:hypothetical protein
VPAHGVAASSGYIRRGRGDFSIERSAPEAIMNMNLHLSLGPLVSLIAGVLILLVPRLLNYIVAIYLIVMGLLGLFGATGGLHFR